MSEKSSTGSEHHAATRKQERDLRETQPFDPNRTRQRSNGMDELARQRMMFERARLQRSVYYQGRIKALIVEINRVANDEALSGYPKILNELASLRSKLESSLIMIRDGKDITGRLISEQEVGTIIRELLDNMNRYGTWLRVDNAYSESDRRQLMFIRDEAEHIAGTLLNPDLVPISSSEHDAFGPKSPPNSASTPTTPAARPIMNPQNVDLRAGTKPSSRLQAQKNGDQPATRPSTHGIANIRALGTKPKDTDPDDVQHETRPSTHGIASVRKLGATSEEQPPDDSSDGTKPNSHYQARKAPIPPPIATAVDTNASSPEPLDKTEGGAPTARNIRRRNIAPPPIDIIEPEPTLKDKLLAVFQKWNVSVPSIATGATLTLVLGGFALAVWLVMNGVNNSDPADLPKRPHNPQRDAWLVSYREAVSISEKRLILLRHLATKHTQLMGAGAELSEIQGKVLEEFKSYDQAPLPPKEPLLDSDAIKDAAKAVAMEAIKDMQPFNASHIRKLAIEKYPIHKMGEVVSVLVSINPTRHEEVKGEFKGIDGTIVLIGDRRIKLSDIVVDDNRWRFAFDEDKAMDARTRYFDKRKEEHEMRYNQSYEYAYEEEYMLQMQGAMDTNEQNGYVQYRGKWYTVPEVASMFVMRTMRNESIEDDFVDLASPRRYYR